MSGWPGRPVTGARRARGVREQASVRVGRRPAGGAGAERLACRPGAARLPGPGPDLGEGARAGTPAGCEGPGSGLERAAPDPPPAAWCLGVRPAWGCTTRCPWPAVPGESGPDGTSLQPWGRGLAAGVGAPLLGRQLGQAGCLGAVGGWAWPHSLLPANRKLKDDFSLPTLCSPGGSRARFHRNPGSWEGPGRKTLGHRGAGFLWVGAAKTPEGPSALRAQGGWPWKSSLPPPHCHSWGHWGPGPGTTPTRRRALCLPLPGSGTGAGGAQGHLRSQGSGAGPPQSTCAPRPPPTPAGGLGSCLASGGPV